MTKNAIHAFGTQLLMSDMAVSPTFAPVAELKTVPFPALDRPRIDVSTHDNAQFAREYVLNMADLPEQNFEINYLAHDPTHDHLTGLLYHAITGDEVDFKTLLNSSVSPPLYINYSARVSKFTPAAPVDNVYSAAVTLQPSAPPTYSSS